MFKVWFSTESVADYFIEHTDLRTRGCAKARLYESDANNARNFHTLPDHIKKILYLDAPDLIVEKNGEPIFSVELSTEAGTGHNVFQRFARLAASVENDVPAFYVYPEAKIVSRANSSDRWDKLNPLIFQALEQVMVIYEIPALFFAFPSHFRSDPDLLHPTSRVNQGLKYDKDPRFASCPLSGDSEMQRMFEAMNEVIRQVDKLGHVDGRRQLLKCLPIRARRNWMNAEYVRTSSGEELSPLTAVSTIPTSALLDRLRAHSGADYEFGSLLTSRVETTVYSANAKFRGDPYPGCLAAIDYLRCREGRTFEDRRSNLVLVFGELSYDSASGSIEIEGAKSRTVSGFVDAVRASESKNLLTTRRYKDLDSHEIPRYYMQCRYGSMFSKVKHIRVYSYFADAILFPDGSLWRDG